MNLISTIRKRAKMNQPKIIFFDIDDTLYRKSTDTLRPSVLQAMRALKAKGILTAIATGRTPAALPAKVQQLIAEAEMDLLVMINGQYIRYQGEVLQKHPLTQIADMQVFFEEHNIPYAFVSEQTIAVSERLPWVEVVLAEILPEHPIDKDYFKKHEVYQMLGFYPQKQDDLVAARAQQSGLKTIRWHEQSVDMLDEQGSKARGRHCPTRHRYERRDGFWRRFKRHRNDANSGFRRGHGQRPPRIESRGGLCLPHGGRRRRVQRPQSLGCD
jgi:hydroxymethylpyrimidine pyrophosphatase-like HAD family hydrolase